MTQKLFFGGTWRSLDARIPVLDPATGVSFTTIPNAGAAETRLAIESAAKGFETWGGINPYQRAKHLRQAADLIRKHAKSFAADTTYKCILVEPAAGGVEARLPLTDVSGPARVKRFDSAAMNCAPA